MAERPESDKGGGWRFDFIGEVHHDFLCAICLLPMKDPQQISACGHCMCQSCLDKVLGSTSKCPQDRKPISKSDVFKDTRMERSIMCLRVKCKNSGRGCKWIGQLVDLLKRHLDTCKKEPIPCMKKECTENPLREVFHWHLLHECKWRMVNCEYCAREIVACQLKVHCEIDCLEYPVSCCNNCGVVTARKQEFMVHVFKLQSPVN